MKKPTNPAQGRARLLTVLVLFTFVGLVAQLGNLTVRQSAVFTQAAADQRTRAIPVFAPRGIIYDRNMEQLVTNRPATSVFIQYPFYKRADVLATLAGILNAPVADIQKQVAQMLLRQADYEPIRIKDDITSQQYTTIVERKNDLPGVELEALPERVYPNKELAAHVLGYVNEIGQDELQQLKPKGYIGGELVGRTGLEAYYEDYLRGKPGIREVEINNVGQPLGEQQTVDPQPGDSLVLTIDANLQRVAENALDWDMWRIRNTIIGDGPWKSAKAGAVVVMDVKSGAVLAMASHPSFDPNMFARGITETELQKLQDPVLTPEVNRAIQTAYQPGSTWKMMTAAAALTNGVIGPYDKLFCSGVFDKAGNPKDWQPGGHGWVDTAGALQNSCDIYFYEMGYRLGIDKMVAMAQQFGFGSKTGIDLGGESPGFLPTAQNRLEIWQNQRNDPWGIGHTVSAAIGQIVQATPIQLVRYTAALGNKGQLMQPYIVDRVIDAQGNTVKQFGPKQVGQVKVSPDYLKVILQGMYQVDAPGGTSDYALYPLPGIKTGGKTGSAEYPPQNDYGFYVSLVPLDNPQIAVVVAIEQGEHGSNTSAVARAIEAHYFNVKLPAYDPANIPKEFPNDLAGLRRKYAVVGSGQ